MVSRVAFVLAVFVAALTAAAPVRAQADEPRGPRLEYATPAKGCPSEETFRHEVAILLGGIDHFRETAPDVVRVTFAKVPGGFRGSVQYTPAKGEAWPALHETASICGDLVRIVAITASMRIPNLPPAPAPPPPEPAPPPPEPVSKPSDPSPPKGAAVEVAPSTPRGSLPRSEPSPLADHMPFTISLSGFVLVTAGLTADASPGFQLAAEARSNTEEFDAPSFRLGLEFRGLLPSKAYAREPVDPKLGTIPGELDVSTLTGLLVPCVRWKYLFGCGVAEGGVLIAKGYTDTNYAPTFRLGPRLGVEVPFAERFAVRAFGEALFAAYTTGFEYTVTTSGKDPNVAWDYPLAVGFFGLGLSIKFD